MSSLVRRLSWNRPPRSPSVDSMEEFGVAHANTVDLDEPTVSDDVSKTNYTFQCNQVQTDQVIIFSDRADITRKVQVQCSEAGTFDVSITGVSLSADDSSIRVATSNEESKIIEVSIKKIATSLTTEKKEQIEKIQKEREELVRKSERLKMNMSWIQSYANSTSGVPMPPSGGIAPTRISTEDAKNFLTFYSEKLEEIIEGREKLTLEISKKDKEIAEMSKKEESKEIRFVFSIEKPCDIEFKFSYVVKNVSWKPTYDIRVKSSIQNLVELTYNGVIYNSSGDSWNDAQISLSTAQPQVGALPPNLNTLFVKLKSEQPTIPISLTNSLAVNPLYVTSTISKKKDMNEDSTVEKGITSSSFSILRKTTIPSNSKPHKVTIKLLQLNSSFSYTILPRLSKYAYLRANCVNDSSYTLLPGKMNVYMDGTFVSTSEIKLTNPTDELTLFLGTDLSIVVDSKENFIRENRGLVSKSILNRYSHSISIKNQKTDSILVNVFDQLPKSQDSKIKVNIVRPQVREDNQEVKLNDFNNLRWQKKIDPSQEYKIEFEYTIEFPSTNQLSFN